MKTLRETTTLLHRAAPPGGGLPDADLVRVVGWFSGILEDLDRLHRDRRWHGEIGPDAARIHGDRARLDPPTRSAPPEFRDPERERLRLMRGVRDPALEARQDVYGAGALLYFVLENGAPPAGSGSALTRPVPAALAHVVYRAMAEGGARYPTAEVMRADLERLLRLSRGGDLADVRPDALDSHEPGEAPRPRRLIPYRVAARRERRSTKVLVVGAIVALLALAAVWRSTDRDGPEVRAAQPAATENREPSVRDLLATWREDLSSRLAASGEILDPDRVPLLVVGDVRLPRDLGWLRHPSARLGAAVRAALERGANPAEIDALVRSRVAGSTIPAVLRVRALDRDGLLELSLDYRGVRVVGVARLR